MSPESGTSNEGALESSKTRYDSDIGKLLTQLLNKLEVTSFFATGLRNNGEIIQVTSHNVRNQGAFMRREKSAFLTGCPPNCTRCEQKEIMPGVWTHVCLDKVV
jgi:hypothetical protein